MNSVQDETFNSAHNTSLEAQKMTSGESCQGNSPLQAGRVNP